MRTKFNPLEVEMWEGEINGQKVMYLLPPVHDDYPAEFKSVLALRNKANLTGECPVCGAVRQIPNRAERRANGGKLLHGIMEHNDDCPVCDDNMRDLVQRLGMHLE